MSRDKTRRAHGGPPMTMREVMDAESAALPASPMPTTPLHSAEDRAFIRLELLRLAHRHDHSPEQIVERCKALEAYVFDDQPADKF